MGEGIDRAVDNSTRFVVLGSQRSGTVFIESLISSHPEAHCWGEILLGMDGPTAVDYPAVLHQQRILRHAWQQVMSGSALRPAKVIRMSFMEPSVPAVGFRLMYNQARWRERRAVVEMRARVIHIRRDNSLRQYVSLTQMRRRQRELGAHSAHARDGVRFPAVHVDPGRALRFVQSQERLKKSFAALFSEQTVLELSYESDILGVGAESQLVAHRHLAASIVDVLNLSPHEMTAKTSATGGLTLSASVSNYGELAEAVLKTRFAWMLDD